MRDRSAPTGKGLGGKRHSGAGGNTATLDPKSPTADTRSSLGNQTLQGLLASGELRAKLEVGSPNDPAEHEADRAADAAVHGGGSCTCSPGGPPCAHCRAAANGIVRRKRDHSQHPHEGAGNLSLGASSALAAGDRAFFESRYNADLSRVRLHDNPQAASTAARLGARAFALGDDIAFARGKYQPNSSEGRLLLAHELAHVLGPHPGIHRQNEPDPNTMSVEPSNRVCAPDAPGRCGVSEPARVEHGADYNACNVNVTALTNYQLLAEYSSALAVVNQGRGATGYFDYRNLQRRLIAERDRRVDLGHAWLATMPAAIPETLYSIVDRGNGAFDVVSVPGATAAGEAQNTAASPLMTRSQFTSFLSTNSVEQVDTNTYQMRVRQQITGGAEMGTLFSAGGLYNTPLDLALRDPFARNITGRTGGEIMKWRGRFGEAGYSSRASTGYGYFLEDLNTRSWIDRRGRVQSAASENYPLMDFERSQNTRGSSILGTARISVKTSLQASQADRLSYYRQGLQSMLETGGRSGMPAYVANQPQFAGQPTTAYQANRSTVLSDSMLAVNHDDVAAFRQLLADPTQRETSMSAVTLWDDRGQPAARRSGWRQVFEGEMREHPVSIGNETFNSPDALDQARSRAQNPITVEQYAAAQREIGARASSRVVSAGISTSEVGSLRTSRMGVGNLTQAQLRQNLTPEYMRAARSGGGVSGQLRAGGGAALRGGGVSSLIAVVTTAGVMVIDEADHPDWERELGVSGGLGAAGGGTGAAAEQLIIAGGTSRMLTSLSTTGASRLTPGLLTGAGRFGGGAVGAMFVEGISMGLLEEREHSGAEVGTRLGRSAALGGGSVWAGAAIGTAVGGPIGFIVGLAIGGLLYYVGDKLVPGGREDWDAHEAGCQPLPTVTRWTSSGTTSNEGAREFRCFDGETPILLADGSMRPIASIGIGDEVLTYNETERAIEIRSVLKLHELPPDLLLELRFENGARLLVTRAHKLGGPYGWCEAGDLRVGFELYAAGPGDKGGGGKASTTRIFSIGAVDPRGPVYDLSVDATHTYFAHGVLAHNKIF